MRDMRDIIDLESSEFILRKDIAEREAVIGTTDLGSFERTKLWEEIAVIKDMVISIKQSDHVHEFYAEGDFTQEEIERHNVLAVAALIDKRKICKRCGYEDCEN